MVNQCFLMENASEQGSVWLFVGPRLTLGFFRSEYTKEEAPRIVKS
jgi:hypothetical protein